MAIVSLSLLFVILFPRSVASHAFVRELERAATRLFFSIHSVSLNLVDLMMPPLPIIQPRSRFSSNRKEDISSREVFPLEFQCEVESRARVNYLFLHAVVLL